MATLEEVISALSTNGDVARCVIDPNTRNISIPSTYRYFGVESDEKVTRIPFTCPKIVGDNIDLSNMNLYVNYRNSRGDLGVYLIDDVEVRGDSLVFSWLLSRNVTETSGSVSYIICAKKSNEGDIVTEWNTNIASATVSSGLEAVDTIQNESHDVIEQILEKLNAIDPSGNIDGTDVLTKVSQLENDAGYLTEHQDISDKVNRDEIVTIARTMSEEPDEDELNITAGSADSWGEGAWLALRRTNREEKPGSFELYAFSEGGSNFKSLLGDSDGNLTWGGEKVLTEDQALSITDITESTEDGGSNVVTFSDGQTLTIRNGSKGSDGASGGSGTTENKTRFTLDDLLVEQAPIRNAALPNIWDSADEHWGLPVQDNVEKIHVVCSGYGSPEMYLLTYDQNGKYISEDWQEWCASSEKEFVISDCYRAEDIKSVVLSMYDLVNEYYTLEYIDVYYKAGSSTSDNSLVVKEINVPLGTIEPDTPVSGTIALEDTAIGVVGWQPGREKGNSLLSIQRLYVTPGVLHYLIRNMGSSAYEGSLNVMVLHDTTAFAGIAQESTGGSTSGSSDSDAVETEPEETEPDVVPSESSSSGFPVRTEKVLTFSVYKLPKASMEHNGIGPNHDTQNPYNNPAHESYDPETLYGLFVNTDNPTIVLNPLPHVTKYELIAKGDSLGEGSVHAEAYSSGGDDINGIDLPFSTSDNAVTFELPKQIEDSWYEDLRDVGMWALNIGVNDYKDTTIGFVKVYVETAIPQETLDIIQQTRSIRWLFSAVQLM